jgi:3-oxoacyl-[acyl-carrier protein] reductase
MSNFQNLKGKKVFITGATGGIGQSIAVNMAKNGCHLFLTGTNQRELEKLKNELSSTNVNIEYAVANFINISDIYSIVDLAKSSLQTIDIVINSAGIFPNLSLFESEDDDYKNVMDINLRSAFIFTREFAQGMVERKWGRVVNIGSSSAYNGFGNTSLYCASKHALLGFSKSINEELKQYNVRTYCISPSSTKSKMGLETKGQDYSTFLDPDDIAKYVLFMISFDSNIISEEILLKRMVTQ